MISNRVTLKSEAGNKQPFGNLTNLYSLFLLLTGCILLNGCAGVDLTRDSSQISGGYEEATNQQMLLNMARLQNDDTPYFVQLSNITTQNQLSSSAQFSPSNMNELHNTGQTTMAALSTQGPSTWTLGGMLQGSVAQTPTYTFVPLNGDALSQVTSVPLTSQLFYDFVRQGICIDMVARLMLNSFDVPVKIFAGTATFKGFDGQGKMLFSAYNLYKIDDEIADIPPATNSLAIEMTNDTDEFQNFNQVIANGCLTFSDQDKRFIDAAASRINSNQTTFQDKQTQIAQDKQKLDDNQKYLNKQDVIKKEEDSFDEAEAAVDQVKATLEREITDAMYDNPDNDKTKMDRSKLEKIRADILKALDTANPAVDKVYTDRTIIPLAGNPSQLLPIQDSDGYYLNQYKQRVLDKNGNYCDVYGNLVMKSNAPVSAFNNNVQVAVYFSTTYTLQNNPLSPSYPDFLVWCYNQRLLQEHFMLSVQDSTPQENHKPDQIYSIKDLKLADIVSAMGSGYEVIPADAPNAPANPDAPVAPSDIRYIVKKTSASSSSLKVSSLKVNQDDYKLDSKISGEEAQFSDDFTRLYRLTSKVTAFEKQEPIFNKLGGADSQSTTGSSIASNDTERMELLSLPTSAETTPTDNETSTSGKSPANPNGLVLNIRTFLAVLRGVAKEQLYFENLPPILIKDKLVKSLMTLEPPTPVIDNYFVLSYQNYRGNRYYIGDAIDRATDHDFFQQENKRAFTIITLLFSDVALDPTKLQQPVQIIQ